MRVLDVLLPRRCAVCARIGSSLCDTCLPLLLACGPPWCERCGAPGPWPVKRCAECSGRRLAFATARAAVVYEAHARVFVRSWKERGRRDLTAIAAGLVTARVSRPRVDAISFVPADRDRELIRGHATAQALAGELAAAWELPLLPLLRRRPGSRRQRDLPRAERRANVTGAFSILHDPPRLVCLVDDVYTTGATVSACSTALRRAGTRQVHVACFARAVR